MKPITNDVKADIARVVRSLETDWHGMCLWRALTGCAVLRHLGLEARLMVGGMVYRAGPDELRDCVAFCGAGNAGRFHKGQFLGHYWIASGTDLIDFSVGDWQKEVDLLYGIDDLTIPPVVWTASGLPEFWWDQDSVFVKPDGCRKDTPELGKAWYTRDFMTDDAAGDRAKLDAGIAEVMPMVKLFRDHIRGACAGLRLKERIG